MASAEYSTLSLDSQGCHPSVAVARFLGPCGLRMSLARKVSWKRTWTFGTCIVNPEMHRTSAHHIVGRDAAARRGQRRPRVGGERGAHAMNPAIFDNLQLRKLAV